MKKLSQWDLRIILRQMLRWAHKYKYIQICEVSLSFQVIFKTFKLAGRGYKTLKLENLKNRKPQS